jgi:hypothetical protein
VLAANGSAVEFVGVRVEVPRFLPVPVDGRELLCHDEIVLTVLVPVNGSDVSCHDETVKMASKKQGTSASAASPIDFVLAAGPVRVVQNLISGVNFFLIDFWG